MPLLDHFHPPLSERRHWDSFHGAWAEAMAIALNSGQLPERYFAEARVKLGRSVEIDVGTMEESGLADKGGNGVAVWAPPQPALRAPLTVAPPEIFEVQVLDGSEGPRLVAAIELVSPANKDRPSSRRAFSVKCASYLHDEVSVIVVDVVTERHAGLHGELLELLGVPAGDRGPAAGDLYTAAYRTLEVDETLVLESWLEQLSLGNTLPSMPLWIGPKTCLSLDLETTYQMACVARRIS
jgi:hypothetical protein